MHTRVDLLLILMNNPHSCMYTAHLILNMIPFGVYGKLINLRKESYVINDIHYLRNAEGKEDEPKSSRVYIQ